MHELHCSGNSGKEDIQGRINKHFPLFIKFTVCEGKTRTLQNIARCVFSVFRVVNFLLIVGAERLLSKTVTSPRGSKTSSVQTHSRQKQTSHHYPGVCGQTTSVYPKINKHKLRSHARMHTYRRNAQRYIKTCFMSCTF